MALKVISFIFLVNIVFFVSGYANFDPPTDAIDNSLYEEVLDEELCAEQINFIRSTPMLALYFADAGIRIPKGILQGNTVDMGNYHQCINYNQPLPDSELQGKYCVIRVPLNQDLELPNLPIRDSLNFDASKLRFDTETVRNIQEYQAMQQKMKWYTGMMDDDSRIAPENPLSTLTLSLAVCVPKPCTTRQAFDSFLFNVSDLGFQYNDAYCRLPNDKPWAPADWVATVFFSLIGLLTLVSTTYDVWFTFIKKEDPKSLSVIGKSFSVYTNGRRLMTYSSGSDTIECLDGIRALAMAWVIIGHAFVTEVSWTNPIDAALWSRSWQYLWAGGGTYTVDTFFTLSGFLVVYTTVGKVTGMNLLKKLHLFYLNRLLRMFPVLATIVLLEASFLNHMTDGPNWNGPASYVNRCRATWWSTLLHVQNYVTPGQMCIIQSWYLAIDVQLHILSPIILFWVLSGKKKYAWGALSIGCIGVLTASTIYIFIKEFPHAMGVAGREHEGQDYLYYYYMNTFTRAPPFLIGMIFGYAVRMTKIKLRGVWIVIFWICLLSLTTYLIYSIHPMNQPEWDNQIMTSIFNAFYRSLWALAVCPINWLLSLQMWKIHSRLSYAMYLVHCMLMVSVNGTAVTTFYFTPAAITFKFLAHYAYAMAWSFCIMLTIDAPCSTLFKLMLGSGVKKEVTCDGNNPTEPTKQPEKQV